mgnify:CR=1 FL=1
MFKNECADGGWRKNGEAKKEKRIFPEENCFNGICIAAVLLCLLLIIFVTRIFHEKPMRGNRKNGKHTLKSNTGGSESGL